MKKQIYFSAIFFLSLIIFHVKYASAQSFDRNFVKTQVPCIEITDATQVANLGNDQIVRSVTYSDGLGRPVQKIIQQATDDWNGYDLVLPVEYDQYGRQPKSFLPYVASGNDATFKADYAVMQPDYYMTAPKVSHDPGAKYAESYTESSPLSRITEQAGPGSGWQMGNGHTTAVQYNFNTTNELLNGGDILIWNVTTDGNGFPTGAHGDNRGAYKLYATKVTDEDGKTGTVYNDYKGRVICRRTDAYTDANDKTNDFTNGGDVNSGGAAKSYLSYYVYDTKGRLAYYLPPGAVLRMMSSSTFSFTDDYALSDVTFKEFIYAYHYDNRNRQIEKYIPGAGWERYIYNKSGAVIMSQDEKQRTVGEWTFKKCDALGRTVVTGKCEDGRPQQDIQSEADNAATVYEVRDNSAYGYTSNAMPQNILEIYSVNYFDNYDFSFDTQLGSLSYQPYGTNEKSDRVDGFPTAGKIKVLGTGTYLYNIGYYNDKGQLIQLQKQNYLDNANSWDVINNEYNFNGQLIHNERTHNAFANPPLVIKTDFTYNHMGKLLDIFKQVNNETQIHEVYNEYNGIGQLVRKNLHYDYNFPFGYMQRLDYRYNIRGWLTSINNADLTNDGDEKNADDNDVFGEELFYDQPGPANGTFSNLPLYGGNVAAMKWRTKGYTVNPVTFNVRPVHSYNYRYDDFNKLTAGYYAHNSDADPVTFDQEINVFMEKESYDVQGNIQTLQRMARNGSSGGALTDDLTYTYFENANKLAKVDDAVTASLVHNDFVNGSGPDAYDDYTFDENGSITDDQNKGLSISYNFLKQPENVSDLESAYAVQYVYDAAGNKLQKVFGPSVHDYVNGIEYENGELESVAAEEGRIRPKRATALNTDTYVYDYMIKDHLGNVRVILSNEILSDDYMATMELINDASERQLFYNIPSTRDDKPNLMPDDNTYTPDEQVSDLDPAAGRAIGHAKALEVSMGDRISINTRYFFTGDPFMPVSPRTVQDILNQLAGVFFPGFNGGTLSPEELLVVQQAFTQNAGLTSFLSAALTNSNNDPTRPLAFLTWILLDRNLNFIPEGSGVLKAENPDQLGNLAVLNLEIPDNGYLYMYVSNETGGKAVSFDNLRINHVPGYVMEENHYYPYGLLIEQLSYPARRAPGNKYKYQNKELQQDLGMNMLDFGARQYDAVLGRWIVQDPMHQFASPYLAMGDNPVSNIDPDGRLSDDGEDEGGGGGCLFFPSGADFGRNGIGYNSFGYVGNFGGAPTPGHFFQLSQQWNKDHGYKTWAEINKPSGVGEGHWEKRKCGDPHAGEPPPDGFVSSVNLPEIPVTEDAFWDWVPDQNSQVMQAGMGVTEIEVFLAETINRLSEINNTKNFEANLAEANAWKKLTGRVPERLRNALSEGEHLVNVTKFAARGLFVVGALMSAEKMIEDPTTENLILGSADIVMGAVSLACPVVGLVYFTGRFIYDVYEDSHKHE